MSISLKDDNENLNKNKKATRKPGGSIKGQALCKLSSCQDDFACLIWSSVGKVSYKEVQLKKICLS